MTPEGDVSGTLNIKLNRGNAVANNTNYEVRYENFGDGLETWAIYQITKNDATNTSVSTHVRDAKTEEAAFYIVDALTGVKAA
jgi:hypothetical protein